MNPYELLYQDQEEGKLPPNLCIQRNPLRFTGKGDHPFDRVRWGGWRFFLNSGRSILGDLEPYLHDKQCHFVFGERQRRPSIRQGEIRRLEVFSELWAFYFRRFKLSDPTIYMTGGVILFLMKGKGDHPFYKVRYGGWRFFSELWAFYFRRFRISDPTIYMTGGVIFLVKCSWIMTDFEFSSVVFWRPQPRPPPRML
jgi:hypothetical protein